MDQEVTKKETWCDTHIVEACRDPLQQQWDVGVWLQRLAHGQVTGEDLLQQCHVQVLNSTGQSVNYDCVLSHSYYVNLNKAHIHVNHRLISSTPDNKEQLHTLEKLDYHLG